MKSLISDRVNGHSSQGELATSSAKYTTIAAWSLAVARTLSASGIEPNPVFEAAGLSLSQLESAPDSRVAIDLMTPFWRDIEAVTQLSSFGLKVGQYAYPMHFRALGRLMMTSDTLAQAFERLPSYYALISNSAAIKLQRTPQLIGFTITPLDGVEISHMAIDAFFSTLMHHGDLMIGDSSFIHSVDLMRTEPKDSSAWRDCFKAPVAFDRQENCMWMDRGMLERSTLMANPELAAENEHQVRQYLDQMQALSWREKSYQAIHAMLVTGEPTAAKVAQLYNISERSLSRYLKKEETSFRSLLQDKRKELAHYYLGQSELSVTQLADKLGYTCLSNFTRAFHLWYGISPSEYRAQRLSSSTADNGKDTG
ncbi:AraC family transcriptional regulator [Shewanella woodyi]|uniref:AraC family transcriptional regulator n=1 Tax=Shewanella woodyi TaxID=60961 RepID=UPI0009EF113E|nr:AraC family transcriptional regulator [Shewanella woodyi]